MTAYTLKDLAERFQCEVKGNPETVVEHVATIQAADAKSISFLANSKYKKYLSSTLAAAVIVQQQVAVDCPIDALVCADPYVVYAKVAALLHPPIMPALGVHPSAVIEPSARISSSASVGPHCYIGEQVVLEDHVVIGPNCVVQPGCTLGQHTRLMAQITLGYQTHVGQRVLIHPGVVVGADGFGIALDQGRWIKVPQVGTVRVGDDVEIGANTTIDRGAINDTILHEGVKLDNQIQIAHNVEIGAHTAIAGCTAIAGSTRIGQYCTIAGAVGIVGHLKIVDHVHVTAMSLVTKSITKAGSYSSGTPMMATKAWHKSAVRFKQLDQIVRKMSTLFKKT